MPPRVIASVGRARARVCLAEVDVEAEEEVVDVVLVREEVLVEEVVDEEVVDEEDVEEEVVDVRVDVEFAERDVDEAKVDVALVVAAASDTGTGPVSFIVAAHVESYWQGIMHCIMSLQLAHCLPVRGP